MSERMERVQAALAAAGTDLMALGPGPHMRWLLGFHPMPDERPCLLLVTPARAALLMPALNAAEARQHTDLPMLEWADTDGPQAALGRALDALGTRTARRLALDEAMRTDFALLVQRALPGAESRLAGALMAPLRMRKDAAEQAALRENAVIADAAMEAVLAAMAPGVTEAELAQVARAAFREHGAQPLFTIVGAGPNGAFPHHHTGDTPLREGDAVVVDIGARKGAFSSDITRMAAVGHAPEGYAAVHAAVEQAVQAALDAARPGVRAAEVDRAARGVIEAAGYGAQFVHRTGHGMGLEPHEPPWIAAGETTVLEPGMVFTIEPGIYLEGRFGLRLEEVVILQEDGPEVLSRLPRECRVV
ncbi:MAG: M24 family metallopeptidase [Rhodosalinus sp.]